MRLRLPYRLRVDRRKRYVRGSSFTCGRKTLYNVWYRTAFREAPEKNCQLPGDHVRVFGNGRKGKIMNFKRWPSSKIKLSNDATLCSVEHH